jgi:CTP:molybdopterin cytidylyltransferase MocA
VSEYGIILAAGGSSRMGEPKPLLELDGEPLVSRAVRTVRAAGADPLVVLGHGASQITPHVRDAQSVVNAHWRAGMSASLRLAVSRLPDQAIRTLVLTVDQPDVDADLLGLLLDACRQGADAAGTRYPDASVGVPACFNATLFARLTTTSGDSGAREVLRSGQFDIAAIDAPNQTIDVDTPEQWAAYLDARQRRETT